MLWDLVTNATVVFARDQLDGMVQTAGFGIHLPSPSSKLLLDDINKKVVTFIPDGLFAPRYCVNEYPFSHTTKLLPTYGRHEE